MSVIWGRSKVETAVLFSPFVGQIRLWTKVHQIMCSCATVR